MNEAFYLQTSRIEAAHWWFRHRRRLIDSLLRSAEVPGGGAGVALDLGCGSGGNLGLLGEHCATVIGLDRWATPLRLARQKHPESLLVQADANGVAGLFRAGSFQLIALCNVLYHRAVASEESLLRALASLLRPGGLLVMTEPAFPVLFRRHDRVDHGRRRYRLPQLRRWLSRAGLEPLRASYFNAPSFPPALLLAAIERALGPGREDDAEVGELRLPPAPLNRMLEWALRVEVAWIRRGGRIPLGVGAVLLARRAPAVSAGADQVRT